MKIFVLTFVKNGIVTEIIQRQLVQDIQREKKKLISEPKYQGGKFQVRTIEGLKAKRIL